MAPDSRRGASPSRVWGPRAALLGLFALFFVPVLAALVLNVVTPGWLPLGQVNRGELVRPPVPAGLELARSLPGGMAASSGKDGDALWHLVHVGPAPCEERCAEALVSMRQARLALGKDASRVARWWLVTTPADARTVAVARAVDPGLRVASVDVGAALLATPGAAVQLVDPAGFLILRYAQAGAAGAIHKDLKRLLRISKQG